MRGKLTAHWPELSGQDQSEDSFALLNAAPLYAILDGELKWGLPAMAARLFRCSEQDIPRNHDELFQRLRATGRSKRQSALSALGWDGAQYCIEYQITIDENRQIWVEERGSRLSGEGSKPTHIQAILRDVDIRKTQEDELLYRALHDPLTGLWNAVRFTEALVHLQTSLKRFQSRGLLFRLRVTNLDDMNMAYGYKATDIVLSSLADRLKNMFSAPDITARMSGAGFAIALTGIGDAAAEELKSHIIGLLAERPYHSPEGDVVAELDIVHAIIPNTPGFDINALYHSVGIAPVVHQTHDATAPVTMPTAPQTQSSIAKEITEEDILSALNDRRIALAYQPIINAKTRELHHYEALMRLIQEDGSLRPAGEFIMAAEKLGLVSLLDRRALEIAGSALRAYPNAALAVNVSAATVKDPEAVEAYLHAIRALGRDTSRLTVELTETAALGDVALASTFSDNIRGMGCEFAIDDFGAGYTSFKNLMAVEANAIKIDGSFVAEISLHPFRQSFVRMMTDLAHTFSVETVAEMVETRADADLLTRLGVDYLQGYYFGRPMAEPIWRKTP
ncbi:MAG: EAL domain-containing protein [Maricaulaceae bacterium]